MPISEKTSVSSTITMIAFTAAVYAILVVQSRISKA